MTIDLLDWSISYLRTILIRSLSWFSVILGSMNLQKLWLGAVVFVIVFSVILLPLRGGAMLGGGMMSDIVRTKIRNRKNSNKHTED